MSRAYLLRPCALSVLLLAGACGRARPEGPNILLVTLDTTRADHLGCYGYSRPTTPNIDRLADESVVYTNAIAVSSWTLPTHASLFTGKVPSAHGAQYDPQGPLVLSQGIAGPWEHYRARPIAENERTLAQILTEHGYATGGVAGGPWLKTPFRLQKGFEFYDDENINALKGRPADDVTRVAIDFVDEHADEPFFLFLNYYDPHSPYYDPDAEPKYRPEFLRQVTPPGVDPNQLDDSERQKLLYDAEIAFTDREFGRLLDHLRAKGLYEKTWIIVTADHGELQSDRLFGESPLWGHGYALSQAEIHIPLLVKEPGNGRRGRDATVVQQTDVLPTILTRLGLPLPPHIQGRPLGEAHPIVSEALTLPATGNPMRADWRYQGHWRVWIEDGWKFGWSSDGNHFLVDLENDPQERENLAKTRPDLVAKLSQRLESYLAGLPVPGAIGEVEQPDAGTLEALKGLGYTGDERPEEPPMDHEQSGGER